MRANYIFQTERINGLPYVRLLKAKGKIINSDAIELKKVSDYYRLTPQV